MPTPIAMAAPTGNTIGIRQPNTANSDVNNGGIINPTRA